MTAPVAIDGVPFRFADTAGLRDEAGDPIEAIGVERARAAMGDADLVLRLRSEAGGPEGTWAVEPQADRAAHPATAAMGEAAPVLWLGSEGLGPEGAWEVDPQADRADHPAKANPRHRVSAFTGEGLASLRRDLVEAAGAALPRPGVAALNARQHNLLAEAEAALTAASAQSDPLLCAENLRLARVTFDALLGRTTTEDMLDALFGRFCIGK